MRGRCARHQLVHIMIRGGLGGEWYITSCTWRVHVRTAVADCAAEVADQQWFAAAFCSGTGIARQAAQAFDGRDFVVICGGVLGDHGVHRTPWSQPGGDHGVRRTPWSQPMCDHGVRRTPWSQRGCDHGVRRTPWSQLGCGQEVRRTPWSPLCCDNWGRSAQWLH